MDLPNRKEFFEKIDEQEKIYSISLDFDTLVRKGVLKRKKGTKTIFSILKPDKFPEEAIGQAKSIQSIPRKYKGNEIIETYFQFPTDRERIKILENIKKLNGYKINYSKGFFYMWSDNETTSDLLGFKVHADLIKLGQA